LTSVGQKKILIIDDSKLSRLQSRLTLEKRCFVVSELENADDYFKCLWNYTDIGLILLDLRLPGMSGVDVLKRMQEYSCNSWPPVIIVSGNQDAQTIAETIKLGAKDYLVKPVNEEELLQRVERHFGCVSEITKQECPAVKQLWCMFFTGNAAALGSGVAVLDGTTVAGGTSRFYFTGYCNLLSNPVSARLTVAQYAPGPSVFGSSFSKYILVLTGIQDKDEIALTGYMEEHPSNTVTSRMKKLADL